MVCEEDARRLPLLASKTNDQMQSKKWLSGCNTPWGTIKRTEIVLISKSQDNLHSDISQNLRSSVICASVAQILQEIFQFSYSFKW